MSSKVTYRQQFTRCGKQRCHKCREGVGHGPYWYAYWSENGRTMSKYIGSHLPPEIEATKQAIDGKGSNPPGESVQIAASKLHTSHSGSYDPPNADAHLTLRVYLLGQFRVERKSGNAWQAVANRTWHRRRARALLGCLLSSPGRMLGREQAMEALWPDLDIDTAANRLNGAVHELRQILEPDIARPATSRMLRLERDVLKLADPSDMWVDAEAFESLLNKANTMTNPERVEQILEEAAALYIGDYLLEELYSEWATPRRQALRRGWMGLLLNLAELRAARGALTSAIEPLDRLLATDPTHETAVRRLMVLLTQLDRRGEAFRVYQQLVMVLERDYASDPLPETHELYEALRKGHIQVARSTTTSLSAPDQKIPVHTDDIDVASPSPTVRKPSAPIRPASAPIRPANEATASDLSQFVNEATASTQSDKLQGVRFAQAGRKESEQHVVTLIANTRQSGRHTQSPLIGRDRELATMRELMSAVEYERAGHTIAQPPAHFLLLMGESGIGKTRLAEELSQKASAHNWSVVWSRAYEQECTIPYRPWIDVLRTLLQDTSTEFLLSSVGAHPFAPGAEPRNQALTAHAKLERLSVLLPELSAREGLGGLQRSAPPLPPEQERLHLWETTLGLLSALSKTSPLLLVLDDLHWADESSLELLAYLVRHLQDERILFVGTCRGMELTPTSSLRTLINDLKREQAIVTLPVQPLTKYEIRSLVAYLPESIVTSIETQAGGNPFFAEELARLSETHLQSSAESGMQLAALSAPIRPASAPIRPANEATASSFAQAGRKENNDESSVGNRPNTMPETIAAVLDRRLSRLSNDCQTLLGKAAVLGGSFELNHLLFMASDQSQLLAPIRPAFFETAANDATASTLRVRQQNTLETAANDATASTLRVRQQNTYEASASSLQDTSSTALPSLPFGSDEVQGVRFAQAGRKENEDTILDLLEEALRAGLLVEKEAGVSISYHFWHPLIVNHLYEHLSAARRAQLHRRAANALLHIHKGHDGLSESQLNRGIAADITYHLGKGGGDPKSIAYYAEIAGNQAYTLSAYAQAQRYYRQAIDALMTNATKQGQDPLHLAHLLELVAECNMIGGNFEEVRQLYTQALELRNQHWFSIAKGQNEAELTARHQQEVQLQGLIWHEIGRAWGSTGDYAHAHECYARGKQVMYEAGVTSGTAWACIHLQMGCAYWMEGNYVEAHRYAEEALEILEQTIQYQAVEPSLALPNSPETLTPALQTLTARATIGDPYQVGRAYEILGVIAFSLGQFTEALTHLNTALAIFERHNSVTGIAETCGNLGAVYTAKAEYTKARHYHRRCLELAERVGNQPDMALATGNLGDVAMRCGDLQEAEDWSRRSLAIAERINDREHQSWCNVILAISLLDQGNMSGALTHIRRGLALGRAMKGNRWIGFALVALGDWRVTQAMTIYNMQTMQTTSSEEDSTVYNRLLIRAKAALERALALEGLEAEVTIEGQLVLASVYFLLGDLETAQHKATQAMEEARSHEFIRMFARSQRLLGRILAAQSQPAQADHYLEEAIQTFRKYEMRLDYARTLHDYGYHLMQRSQSGEGIYERGLAFLREARAIFADCKAASDLEWAENVLDRTDRGEKWARGRPQGYAPTMPRASAREARP